MDKENIEDIDMDRSMTEECHESISCLAKKGQEPANPRKTIRSLSEVFRGKWSTSW